LKKFDPPNSSNPQSILKKVGRPNLFHYPPKEGVGTTRRREQIDMGPRPGVIMVVMFLFPRERCGEK